MIEVPVERGLVRIFANAIGDPNPVYRSVDAARAAGFSDLLAPPTFVRVSAHFDPDYPLRPKIGEPWLGSGRLPSGTKDGKTAKDQEDITLHAEQHFEYHRVVCANSVLTVRTRSGRTWSKRSHNSGELQFSETITEFLDEAGELAVTAHSVSVVTQKSVKGGPS